MKIISTKAKFGNKLDQKFYHERFANYKEFYDVLMSRQCNAYRTLQGIMDGHDYDWIGKV